MAFFSKFCCTRDSKRKKQGEKEAECRIFALEELQLATKNFNYNYKLGEGGFGSVYWGQLSDGSQVAVKRLKSLNKKAEIQFSAEVKALALVRHKNLLNLRGYSVEGQERLIVYDYMKNFCLLSHLHGQHSSENHLNWNRRMAIAVGIAEGISFLHHSANPHIIHRDIKASNVLLDESFKAKIADFGFAKLIPEGASHVTTKVKGTLGYLAPEYAMLGQVKKRCDVYSFGILLLEIASGRKPLMKISSTMRLSITDWALPLACERRFSELADKRLNGEYVEDELKRMVFVGLICAHDQPGKRPTMLQVVELLNGKKFSVLEDDDMFKNKSYSEDSVESEY